MARKKEIRRQQILEVAYHLALTDGIGSLTARNIAQSGNFSTQPIYLEFRNMADVKRQVLQIISANLRKEIENHKYVGQALTDLDLAYVDFAQKQNDLFRAMFTDGRLSSKVIADTLLELGYKCFHEEYPDVQVSDEKLRLVIMANWIAVTGLAALVVNRVATFSQEQMIDVLKKQVQEALNNEDLDYVKENPLFNPED